MIRLNKTPGLSPGSFFGAETQNRTVDTTIFSRMLYQLSYLGEPLFLNNVLYYTSFRFSVKEFKIFVTVIETSLKLQKLHVL